MLTKGEAFLLTCIPCPFFKNERLGRGGGGEVHLDCLVSVAFWSRIALTLGQETDSNETSKQRCVIK